MTSKVSVIIPVYNGEQFLGEAIESALNQTYENIEVIVVDDGSTDHSMDVALEYGVQVISKANGGTASALNAGIVSSTGEWIKWLSADDVMYPDALEKMMRVVSITPKHDSRIFYTHYTLINEYGDDIGVFTDKEYADPRKTLMQFFFGNGSTSLIHINVFKKIGPFKELPHSEDYEFWLRAAHDGIRHTLIPIYSIKYRSHPKQLTNTVGGSLDEEIRRPYV